MLRTRNPDRQAHSWSHPNNSLCFQHLIFSKPLKTTGGLPTLHDKAIRNLARGQFAFSQLPVFRAPSRQDLSPPRPGAGPAGHLSLKGLICLLPLLSTSVVSFSELPLHSDTEHSFLLRGGLIFSVQRFVTDTCQDVGSKDSNIYPLSLCAWPCVY